MIAGANLTRLRTDLSRGGEITATLFQDVKGWGVQIEGGARPWALASGLPQLSARMYRDEARAIIGSTTRSAA